MGKSSIVEITDVLRYNYEKGKRVPIRDCEIAMQFFFDKADFFLLRKGGTYIVSTPYNGDLILLTKTAVKDGNYEKTPGEAVGEFRKGYLKNKITRDKVISFIEDPVKYEKDKAGRK